MNSVRLPANTSWIPANNHLRKKSGGISRPLGL